MWSTCEVNFYRFYGKVDIDNTHSSLIILIVQTNWVLVRKSQMFVY